MPEPRSSARAGKNTGLDKTPRAPSPFFLYYLISWSFGAGKLRKTGKEDVRQIVCGVSTRRASGDGGTRRGKRVSLATLRAGALKPVA